jgi:hypothetical protein
MREQQPSPCRTVMDKAVLLDLLTKSQWHLNHHYIAWLIILSLHVIFDFVSVCHVKVSIRYSNAVSIKVH